MAERRGWSEEFVVRGNEAVSKVRELIKKGKARKIIVRKESGEKMFEIPLNTGVAVGGIAALAAPVLAAVGAAAALMSFVKIEVVRTDGAPPEGEDTKANPETPESGSER